MTKPEEQVEDLLKQLGYEVYDYQNRSPTDPPNTFYKQVWRGGYLIDFAMPRTRIAIEVDGVYWHGKYQKQVKIHQVQARIRDTQKRALLEANGWTLINVDESSLRRPQETAKSIQTLILQSLEV